MQGKTTASHQHPPGVCCKLVKKSSLGGSERRNSPKPGCLTLNLSLSFFLPCLSPGLMTRFSADVSMMLCRRFSVLRPTWISLLASLGASQRTQASDCCRRVLSSLLPRRVPCRRFRLALVGSVHISHTLREVARVRPPQPVVFGCHCSIFF